MTTEKIVIWQPGGAYPDPHLWIEPRSLLNIRFSAFEGLVRYDAKRRLVPQLAEFWDVSEDARIWTFTLRKDVRFHDGTPLTAADAAASIRHAASKEIPGALGTDSLLYGYLGSAAVEVLDELCLRVTLPEPMADLQDLLAYIMIIPEQKIGSDPETIPGTGPFRYGGKDGNRYRFVRFADHWAGVPDAEELIFVPEKDEQKRINALLRGEADIITDIQGKNTPRIDTDDDCCVAEYESPVAVPLMLNCFSGPFSDARVRQAVNYGTDVDEIIRNVLGGMGVPLPGPLSRNHFGVNPRLKPYPYDTKTAWQLLAEAGYSDGLEVTMYRPAIQPDESAAVFRCLKQQWARIGIKLHEAVQEDRQQYALDVRAKKIHDLCIFDSAPLSTWRVLHEKLDSSVQGPWWQGYDSPAFNALLAKAAETVDAEGREKLYRDALEIVVDDAPWVFLYSPVNFSGARWDTMDRFPELCRRIMN